MKRKDMIAYGYKIFLYYFIGISLFSSVMYALDDNNDKWFSRFCVVIFITAILYLRSILEGIRDENQ